MPGTSANKHLTVTSREAYLQRIAKLDRRGYSQFEIAEEVGVSQPLVSKDLKLIRTRYVEDQKKAREEYVAEKLSMYAEIRKEAWAAYDRSKKVAVKEVEEFITTNEENVDGSYTSSEVRIKRIKTREGRLPANQYLTTIIQTLEAERELLGLDAPKKVDANVGVFDWAAMAKALETPSISVEEELAKQIGVDATQIGVSAVVSDIIESTLEKKESTNGQHREENGATGS